jgi:hypothetical protein
MEKWSRVGLILKASKEDTRPSRGGASHGTARMIHGSLDDAGARLWLSCVDRVIGAISQVTNHFVRFGVGLRERDIR